MYYQDEHGQLHSVPAHWTDVLPADPFRILAAGRAYFRPSELQQLATLLTALKSASLSLPTMPKGLADCLANKDAYDK